MSQKLAPSIRVTFPLLALSLQCIIIVLFALFVKYSEDSPNKYNATYPVFQDVNTMVFIGFGFLATFLKRYGRSGIAFTMLLAAFALQWATILEGLLFDFRESKIQISIISLIHADLSAVSALVSMGAVLGKTSPVQLLLMTILEVTCFTVNKWLLDILLQINRKTSDMYLHLFGAVFGLMVSRVLHRSGLKSGHEKEGSLSISDLYSMIGTIFLWMFWPSFNAALLDMNREKAIFNTYYALAACTVAVFATSSQVHDKGKIDMSHIRSATLAGGVAIGLSAPLIPYAYIAMIIGLIAGVISTLGMKYLKGALELYFDLHDTCGVLYTHGLPGIIGGIVHIALLSVPSVDRQHADYWQTAMFITMAMSILTGLITGFILKLNIWKRPPDLKCYDDQAYWEFPHQATED
ncbi:rh blood group, D antigen isoform X1 [Scyliorhinus canicula]|uniref:rh blood group, D antigen isoform X1 n=1 Tax=Scyliorhinus canicula TaxID=7830 RepID=UPI0018F2A838|nr:rh blood group, D antigen isoform X1 [Scyliorhinus canicula]